MLKQRPEIDLEAGSLSVEAAARNRLAGGGVHCESSDQKYNHKRGFWVVRQRPEM